MAEDKSRGTPETPERVRGEMSEAEIDRNLAETFPASDPPSWTLGTDHQHETLTPEAEPPARGESESPPSTD
jgi:hypothetical protein